MTLGNFLLGSRSDDDMELDDAAFNQPLEDLVKEKAVSLLIELRAKGNIPYTESLDFIRRLSTFIDILIFSTLKSFNQAFLGISEVNEVFEKNAAFNDQLEIVKSALLDLDSEYKIQKLYERHPLFVKRETVSVGSRNEILPDGTIKIVECTTEYVPITKTIESLFKSPAFVKFFF
jgi:hypothetical protein